MGKKGSPDEETQDSADEASDASFPASDPPASAGSHAGPPAGPGSRKQDTLDRKANWQAARAERQHDPERAETIGRDSARPDAPDGEPPEPGSGD